MLERETGMGNEKNYASSTAEPRAHGAEPGMQPRELLRVFLRSLALAAALCLLLLAFAELATTRGTRDSEASQHETSETGTGHRASSPDVR